MNNTNKNPVHLLLILSQLPNLLLRPSHKCPLKPCNVFMLHGFHSKYGLKSCMFIPLLICELISTLLLIHDTTSMRNKSIRGPCLRGHYLFWSTELLELNSKPQTTNMKQKSLRDQHIILEPLIRFLHSAKHVQPSFPVFPSDD